MNLVHKTFLIILSLAIISSCKKDSGKDATNPPVTNTQEQITTVVLTGSSMSGQFVATWEDLDGAGGKAPVIDTMLLDTGMEYTVSVLLLDKTKTPWDTISNEVEEEKNVHQLFYTPGSSLTGKMSIQILDFDDNTPGLPVGLIFSMDTRSGAAYALPVAGNLRMVLSHYDGIPKTTAPSPESDIDIQFPVRLQ